MKTERFYIGNIGPFKRNSSFYTGFFFIGFSLFSAIESLKDGFQYSEGDLMFIIPTTVGGMFLYTCHMYQPYDVEDAFNFERKCREELNKMSDINYAEAFFNINQALAIYPRDPSSQSAYQTRAYLKERIGKYEDAISDYTSAIETSPENDNQPDYFPFTPQSCLYRQRGQTKKLSGNLQGFHSDLKIAAELGGGHYRAFVDSAPVLERALAKNAGLGWIGKNTMLINEKAGSWFFLGEIYTDIPLPADASQETEHCGSCRACLDICPTNAFTAPWVLDARKCISYLTIEYDGVIPEHLREGVGNRIYGCDDCQIACPWNKFARQTQEPDFAPRHALDAVALLDCFSWSEETFLAKTEGSAIRRIGFERWRRNVAVALGNAPSNAEVTEALTAALDDPSELVREHVRWALAQHR